MRKVSKVDTKAHGNFNPNIMRKTFLFIATCMMICASCQQSAELESSESSSEFVTTETAPVNLTFFDVSMEDITSRAATRADESTLKTNEYFTRLDVSFFSTDYKKTYQYHQTTDSTDFGNLTVSLPIGNYKLVAIAHKLDEAFDVSDTTSVSSPYTEDLSDVAYIFTGLTVGTSGATSVCQLERPIAAFKLTSTDLLPDTVYSVKVTLKDYCGNSFDPRTSFADSPAEYSLIKVPTHKTNSNTTALNFFMFVAQQQQYVDIHVDILDVNGVVLNEFDFDDVYIEQKKRTTYTGAMYSPSANELSFSSTITNISDMEDSGGSMDF